ncbi:MAG: phage head morphogenesis protein [Chloroflexi bacterium]|nr:phage head morphogenesis protein [Chloroflexota bacterium]
MPESPEELTEIATRHQVYLEGLKTHETKKAEKFLNEINKIVSIKLAGKDLTDYSRIRLNKLLKSIRADLKIVSGEYAAMMAKESIDIAKYERSFELKSLGQVVAYDFVVPTASQLRTAIFENPLTISGADNGKMLKPFLRDVSNRSAEQIAGIIQAGYYEGQTTPQIIKNIKGTRGARYTDGALFRINRALGVATRTAVQHAAVQAREQVWQNNKDIVKKVRWVSTLDGRTSAVCRSLDGREFPVDKGIRPPAHPNCRSTVVAVLDSRFDALDRGATRKARSRNAQGESVVQNVSAKETYYSWLKRQPAAFQASVIGESRAKLLRNGGMSADRFSELQLSSNFKEMTLADLNQLEPQAFQKANI